MKLRSEGKFSDSVFVEESMMLRNDPILPDEHPDGLLDDKLLELHLRWVALDFYKPQRESVCCWGTTTNPHASNRTSGGSSGGETALIVAGENDPFHFGDIGAQTIETH